MLLFMILFLMSSTNAHSEGTETHLPTFTATAYVRDCPGCTGYTAWQGIVANPYGPVKIMAVDPKVLKLGKCYRVRFVDEINDGHESIYLAADTGGDIKGHRVDLLLKSVSSARSFGAQDVHIVGETTCPVDVSKLPRAN